MKNTRTKILSLRIDPEMHKVLEQAAARLTIESGERHTLTDIVESALAYWVKRNVKTKDVAARR